MAFPHFTLHKKITIVLMVSCSILLFIIARLFYLQINLNDQLFTRSKQNFLRMETTPSSRGNIVDRYGNLLATNRPVINLYWQGTGSPALSSNQLQLLTHIDTVIPLSISNDPLTKKRVATVERHYKELQLATDLSVDQLSKIEELFPNHPNLIIKTSFKRFYPYKTYASHALGYISRSLDVPSFGKMGLEKMFEELLKGENGTSLKVINSVGRQLETQPLKNALNGQHIQTTIDIRLQELCEQVFPPDVSGTFILMDPSNGDIVALLSRPNFDPNIFLEAISNDSWQSLQENNPFLNRAFDACYPPGSIFKLITIGAALENNLISPLSTWYCNGYLKFRKRKYWCHLHRGHGELNVSQALAHSCNILCFEIAKQIDIDLLATYAGKFGLGQKTNVLFPEKTGLVPSRAWKQQVKNEPWWPGETLSVTIGQSFLLATPIQIAAMISSIFTGFLPTPRILMAQPITQRPLDIHPDTLEFLKKSMKLAVTTGTGRQVNTVKNFEIYAKTSTAQTSDLSKRAMGLTYMEHGWFVLHITYKEMPPLVAVILIEHAGSSSVATTVAKNFLIKYKSMIDKQTK
jgi:penicillin-binding protein 2